MISSNHESILRALEFLRSKNIPLKRVTVSDIESGNSAAILELVWRVFCHFVIEPLAETPEGKSFSQSCVFVILNIDWKFRWSSETKY